MRLKCLFLLPLLCVAFVTPDCSAAEHDTTYTRVQDVIYGRKWGTALVLDVLKPAKNRNGKAVIWIVSGGWYSSREQIQPEHSLSPVPELTKRGYTVFAVTHGSQPRFSTDEILYDMHRAVRFIRHHAGDYDIDPARIGITGMSSGGHLSMMQATAGKAGDPNASDPVERQSSRVQAVACFCPPTDFLNYGTTGSSVMQFPLIKPFLGAFDFSQLDTESRRIKPVTDQTSITEILRRDSPAQNVSADDPPTLIFHADGDPLVPYQQAQLLIGKLEQAGVPTKLVTKNGPKHGWNLAEDMPALGDWFDKHLQH